MASTSDDAFQITLRNNHPHNPPREWKCPVDDLLPYIFQLGVEIEQGEWEDSDSFNHDETLPFQVLVSHICARWRSIALGTPRIWTILNFRKHPRLARAKEYISRSNGLALSIAFDCVPECGYQGLDKDKKTVLSLQEVDQILDLLEPSISHWGKISFYSILYDYAHLLMSRLQNFPAAPSLESFQVHIYGLWTINHQTRYLPFHGQAPNLKRATFSRVQINWEAALPNFLRGLRDLELSSLTEDVWPTYAAFTEIIKNSPNLRTLTLAPHRPVPLAIPSLTELKLRLSVSNTDFVQNIDLPNLTYLDLMLQGAGENLGFVRTLAEPAKGRDQSLLQQITHLKISGLCDVGSVEILLSQLTSLKTLNLPFLYASHFSEERVILDKLVDSGGGWFGSAPSSTTSGPLVDSPKVFCPKLEEISTTGLNAKKMKELVIARRSAGAPLKKVTMVVLDYQQPVCY